MALCSSYISQHDSAKKKKKHSVISHCVITKSEQYVNHKVQQRLSWITKFKCTVATSGAVIARLPLHCFWEPGKTNFVHTQLGKSEVQPQGPPTLNVHPLAAKYSAVYTLLQCHQFVQRHKECHLAFAALQWNELTEAVDSYTAPNTKVHKEGQEKEMQ